jgi:hypothetical protein
MAQKSGFHYLGVGCLVAAVVLVVGGAVFGFLVYRWGKGLEAELRDPATRRDKVLEILVGDELPEGYYGMVAVRIPLLLDTAILTDHDTPPGEEPPDFGERGLVYVAMRDLGGDRAQLDDFFDGRSEDPEALEEHHIDIDLGERVARGRVERTSGPIRWVTHRGNLESAHTRGRHEGLITLFEVACPDDDFNRIGIWFGPDAEPEAEAPDGADPFTGSVADARLVERFVGHFRFCPG